ncbi:MAG: AsnC family transcriptional regulator [Streptosporangiales bacterium]|nr:AsnC family transcriptional regulator [Streptosporangiales bacterium]
MTALDGLDRGLIHALQIDGRVSFTAVSEVLGASSPRSRAIARFAHRTSTNEVDGAPAAFMKIIPFGVGW